MNLPITVEEIKKLASSGKIDKNFSYISNPDVMYIAVKEKIELINLVDFDVLIAFCRLFKCDDSLSHDLKKKLFYYLVSCYDYNRLPCEFIDLIDSEAYYVELATKNVYAYSNLCLLNHPYKAKEKEIFESLYEDSYTFNLDSPIPYVKKSSKVLLNLLKKGTAVYFISFFEKEAFNDEVIDYIEKHINLNLIDIPVMYKIPRIKLLKLKKDIHFLFSLSKDDITDEVINYLKSSDFKTVMIDEYINKYKNYPACLGSSKFILMLLGEDIRNIKYFKGKMVSSELLDYLNSHHYLYKLGDNPCLLNDIEIYKRFINNNGIGFLLLNSIELTSEQVMLLLDKIIINNVDFSRVENEYLLNDDCFVSHLVNEYNLSNPYGLENKYLISSLGRSLEKLSKVFSYNDLRIIIREIVESNYHINMIGILNSIDVFKLKDIYDKLYQKESKINNNFNFYHFIKVMEYFSNHLSLVGELNDNVVDDCIITNLALVINRNENVSYNELGSYQIIYHKKIEESDLSSKDKIYKLLVNGDSESVAFYLENFLNIPQLLYLQLDFLPDTCEYRLLDSYVEIVKLLEGIRDSSLNLDDVYKSIKDKFPNPLFDLSVMQENVLRIYAIMYYKLGLDREKLRKKGKCKIINGQEVIDLTGEKFVIYLHTEDFNNCDDFTEAYEKYKEVIPKNYICTMIGSDLRYYDINRKGMQVYELENPNSLIAFGNRDLFIEHTKKPLFRAKSRFVNPVDMAFLASTGSMGTNNEFDFLRIDDCNKKLLSNCTVIFDCDKHLEFLKEEFRLLCENIKILNYKDIYRLIGLSTLFEISNEMIGEVTKRINELGEKEQCVLKDALEKYQLSFKMKEKVR